MKAKPLTDSNGKHSGWVINCPGCDSWHLFDARWEFNGDEEKPTFNPSMLVNSRSILGPRCHSFVKDGKIQFLDDCDHHLANQTVDLGDVT